MQIRYKVKENDPWEKAQITNWAGKVTGKNYSWWNITNQDGTKQAIDLNASNYWERSDSPWNSISRLVDKNPETTDENMEQSNNEKTIDEVFIAQSKEEEIKAKLTELEQWKSKQVYKEVEDTGQECVSLCWIIMSKIITYVHMASKRNRTTILTAQLSQKKAYKYCLHYVHQESG